MRSAKDVSSRRERSKNKEGTEGDKGESKAKKAESRKIPEIDSLTQTFTTSDDKTRNDKSKDKG